MKLFLAHQTKENYLYLLLSKSRAFEQLLTFQSGAVYLDKKKQFSVLIFSFNISKIPVLSTNTFVCFNFSNLAEGGFN